MDNPLDDEAAAMAQAMGFSSFGAQPRPQKRKYNPHADAVTSSDSATAQRAAAKPSVTGSNSTPLGLVASRKPDSAAANADEIDLDEDEDQAKDDDKSANVDNADVLENSAGVSEEKPTQSSAPASVRPPGLPNRPPPGVGAPSSSGGHHPRTNHRREDDDSWSEGYYDPQSNENPWRRLEEAKGLQPLGTWLAPGHRASARS
ncbi:uncharacterized protein TRIREDRAFT_107374 [Trichoderma reesei QM6a]|jgi:hypothetical protein|uniref:Predicted protein n=1 Tax=Hypocrea jecorina (strain QM6a) TaxID=431241 RepID=G0RJH2_HYPJQ|nr:uncharacterized protein TRIREDRAFT_107374 [Trichoderma reesei QM6a]EGR48590.1 predicted protein [Trichoderma reesei QM6a]